MLDSVEYRCVHCLRWMDHVFKQNPPALVPCRACSNPKDAKVTSADGFFEFSNVLISLDLLLLRKDAFAHLVFNTRLGRRPLQVKVTLAATVVYGQKFLLKWESIQSQVLIWQNSNLKYRPLIARFYFTTARILWCFAIDSIDFKNSFRWAFWHWSGTLSVAGLHRSCGIQNVYKAKNWRFRLCTPFRVFFTPFCFRPFATTFSISRCCLSLSKCTTIFRSATWCAHFWSVFP